MIYVISLEISFCVFADHESGGGDIVALMTNVTLGWV